MHSKAGHAPRSYSFREPAARTITFITALGLLAFLTFGLIRADRFFQEGDSELQRPLRRAFIGLEAFPGVTHPLRGVAWSDLPEDERYLSIYDTEDFQQQLKAETEERKGQVSRLQSSLQQPLGPSGSDMPLCHPFNSSTKTVAVVGNGPLTEANRLEIETHDVVIRFNLMNNWQRFREKLDVWIMRHSKEAAAGYWGINNINKNESFEILSQLKGAWLVGGNQTHADRLLQNHPELKLHSPVLMPEAAMNKAFAADILKSPNSYPSTGFVGIQAVLHCTSARVKLHVFGFNWSRKTWSGHNVAAERNYVHGLEDGGRAVVHPTACEGMRECGHGDIDASCHWSSGGRYLCLRGKPRKWIDMTTWVSENRQREFKVDVSQQQDALRSAIRVTSRSL